MNDPASDFLHRVLAHRPSSFSEYAIVPPSGALRTVAWLMRSGDLVSSGETLVRCRSEDGSDEWIFASPFPAQLTVTVPSGHRITGGAPIGVLCSGEALEAVLEEKRREEALDRHRAGEELRAIRLLHGKVTEVLKRQKDNLTALEARTGRLRQENEARRNRLHRLEAAAKDPAAGIPREHLLRALLDRLPIPAATSSSSSSASSSPFSPAPLPDRLVSRLLRLLRALKPDTFAFPPASGPEAPTGAQGAARLLTRLYDEKTAEVCTKHPGLPDDLAREKWFLWNQLRDAHLAALRPAGGDQKRPSDGPVPLPSSPHPQEKAS